MIIDPNDPKYALNQPIKMVCCYATAVVQCQCDDKPIFPLQSSIPTPCPRCGNRYLFTGGIQAQLAQLSTETVQ